MRGYTLWRLIAKLLQCTRMRFHKHIITVTYRRNAQVRRIYDTVSANDMDAFSSIITTPTHIYGHIQTELKHWQRIHEQSTCTYIDSIVISSKVRKRCGE